MDGESIEYVRLGEGRGDDTERFLYVPGFTEGVIAKAPFALEFAKQGYDVIVPDQHRKGIVRNEKGKKMLPSHRR